MGSTLHPVDPFLYERGRGGVGRRSGARGHGTTAGSSARVDAGTHNSAAAVRVAVSCGWLGVRERAGGEVGLLHSRSGVRL